MSLKVVIWVCILVMMISPAIGMLEGDGNISFVRNSTISTGYNLSVNLSGMNYSNWSYFVNILSPTYAITHVHKITTSTFPTYLTGSITQSGSWLAMLYACDNSPFFNSSYPMNPPLCNHFTNGLLYSRVDLDSATSMVGTSPGWVAHATSNGEYIDVTLYADGVQGYSYWVGADMNNHYGVYIPANSYYYYSILRSDYINSGGSGVWTLAIFDANDLSFSKAYYQMYIENSISINFTSVPSEADVYFNTTLICTTPCVYYANQSATYKIVFKKADYNDYLVNAKISMSTTINAIMIAGNNHVSAGCYDENGLDICTYDPSKNGTYSTIPDGTGFDELLKSEGYCLSGTCHISDLIEFMNVHIADLWLLTLGLVIWRFWSTGD